MTCKFEDIAVVKDDYSTWLHSARMHFVLTLPNATEHSACRNILQHHAQMQHWFSYMQPCKQKTDKNQHLLTEFCSIYLHKIHPCLWLIAAVFIIAKNDMKIKCLSHWSTRNTNRPDQWRRDHTGNEMEGHSQKWQMGHTKVCALPRARVGSVWHPGYEERSGGKGHEWKGDRLLGQSEASVSDREQRFMKTENRDNVIESQGKRTREIDSWWIEVKGRSAVRSSNIIKSNKPILISCRSWRAHSDDWAHREGDEGERHLHLKLISCDLHDTFNASAFYVSKTLLQCISIGIYAALHSNVNVINNN